MAIEIACQACGEEFRVSHAAAGKSFRCKVCGKIIRVPARHEEYEDYEEDEESLPRARRRRDEDDDDDRPRKKRRKSTGSSKTLGPAIGLYVIVGLSLVFWVIRAIQLSQIPDWWAAEPGENEANAFGRQVGFLYVAFIYPLINLLILFGAICLHTKRLYPLAVAGCVLASIPCLSPCCVLGMPFGIWGIVVLCDDNVKRSF